MSLGRHDVSRNIKIYPGANHSFFNDRGLAASGDIWRRTLAFFEEHLGRQEQNS